MTEDHMDCAAVSGVAWESDGIGSEDKYRAD